MPKFRLVDGTFAAWILAPGCGTDKGAGQPVLALERSADRTSLTVSDEGPGLNDEQKTKALERFWRGDATTPGTGLGLAIAHQLVEACGGTLTLEDAPGGGLAVVVSLRNAAVPAEPAT